MSTAPLTISNNNGLTFAMQLTAGGLVMGVGMTDGGNKLAIAGGAKAMAAHLEMESGLKCVVVELQSGLTCVVVNVNNGQPLCLYKRKGKPWALYTDANQPGALSA